MGICAGFNVGTLMYLLMIIKAMELMIRKEGLFLASIARFG
jgi:hypothetical protein